ncbi:50S ribosomal protein L23 [Candidatus Woesebacteria bacterium]|nr:50S ribosomal protein L23 [Candidatus Woesebacteria bacterium]
MNIHDVIYKPVLTEKTTQLAQQGVYTFAVSQKATKHQVATVIQTLYKDVVVDSVRIIFRKGKKKRVGRRMATKTEPDKKFALVKLSKGTIDIFPQA